MFNLFKKSKPSQSTGLSCIGTDMHSHLLPGIDDGSPDVETSIRLIRGMMELGYTKFITTPHIYWELYKNTKETIQAAYERLMEGLEKENLRVDIGYAAEYYMDEHFDQLLQSGDPLLAVKDNWVLVEFSFANPPLDLKEKLFEMQMQGYQPIIAHPERYLFAAGDKTFYDTLKDMGCYFQLNLLSYAGAYGKGAQDLSHHLIKKEYYDLLGTDLHNARHLEGLHHPSVAHIAQKLTDSGNILNSRL
jgi:protein-tyrosine phosphatase